jgi:Haem-dependent oxidative N-demethylase, alpha subunit-like
VTLAAGLNRRNLEPDPKAIVPRYRPFLDGSWRLAMGLKALDLRDWIEIDATFAAQFAERRVRLDRQRAEVFQALPESLLGQAEVLALLLDHLPGRFPEVYRRGTEAIENLVTGERFALDLAAWREAPLELAGRLVQEDLCLMRRSERGYRLIAAVLCFPSNWRLADKLGRPLDLIHEPVPGFAERLAAPVERFFAGLQVERPVWRANWTLSDTPELYVPPGHRGRSKPVAAERVGDEVWLRVERQTLRRLPRTRDVLFTIRTYVEPLVQVIDTPATARALADRLRELPDAVAAYKGIAPIGAPLLAWLERRAGATAGPLR